jgi:glucosamine--fructose-6-phosphate aminotransferase (isomerizing)
MDIFDTVTIYDGAEFGENDIPRGRGSTGQKGRTGLILLSQSGETRDLHRCIQIANKYDLTTIGLVNVPDSTIARETHCGVYLNAGREVAVASTKSFTNQCIVLALVAIWFSQERGTCLTKRRHMIQDIRKFALQAKAIMDADQQETVRCLAKQLMNTVKTSNTETMFLLGKGSEEAIAREGALKIKEVAYLHAEGYSSSALKHGPFALICENTPIVLIDVNEEHHAKSQNAMHEVLARGAFVVHISNQMADDSSASSTIRVASNETFSGLLANIYIQCLSYYLALEKGNNPDFPRNLAKVVTVE